MLACEVLSVLGFKYHRFWQCEAFAHLRSGIDSHVWEMVPYLPEFLTCYGWGVRPANWTQYLQTLISIEETPADLTSVQAIDGDEWLDSTFH